MEKQEPLTLQEHRWRLAYWAVTGDELGCRDADDLLIDWQAELCNRIHKVLRLYAELVEKERKERKDEAS